MSSGGLECLGQLLAVMKIDKLCSFYRNYRTGMPDHGSSRSRQKSPLFHHGENPRKARPQPQTRGNE